MRERCALLALLLLGCGGDPRCVDPSAPITPLPIGEAELEDAGGARREAPGGPYLLHFWASWCAPCRRELPALLEAARELDVPMLALSTDAAWGPVRAFFSGPPPREVLRDRRGELARTLGVSTLPDTYLIDTDGRAIRRIGGALDWTRPEIRAWLRTVRSGASCR